MWDRGEGRGDRGSRKGMEGKGREGKGREGWGVREEVIWRRGMSDKGERGMRERGRGIRRLFFSFQVPHYGGWSVLNGSIIFFLSWCLRSRNGHMGRRKPRAFIQGKHSSFVHLDLYSFI